LPSTTSFDIIFAPKTSVAFGVTNLSSVDVYEITLFLTIGLPYSKL
jgi:hypothetical protein